MTQFVSPDDEHDVLETRRVLKIKINTQKRIVRHVVHLSRIETSASARVLMLLTWYLSCAGHLLHLFKGGVVVLNLSRQIMG